MTTDSRFQRSHSVVQDATTTTTLDTTTTTTTTTTSPPHILAKIGKDCQVLNVIPHDETTFTQDLLIHEANFVEGTGNYGESVVRIYDMQDGTIHKQVSMDAEHFGEGIASFANATNTSTNTPNDNDGAASVTATTTAIARLMQLTWKKQIGLIYGVDTLDVVQEFRHATNAAEGWGIAFDASRHELLVSDRSEWIHV
jgi:glutamine cyclotransferase